MTAWNHNSHKVSEIRMSPMSKLLKGHLWWMGGYSSGVEGVLSTWEVLGPIPSTSTKKEKKFFLLLKKKSHFLHKLKQQSASGTAPRRQDHHRAPSINVSSPETWVTVTLNSHLLSGLQFGQRPNPTPEGLGCPGAWGRSRNFGLFSWIPRGVWIPPQGRRREKNLAKMNRIQQQVLISRRHTGQRSTGLSPVGRGGGA